MASCEYIEREAYVDLFKGEHNLYSWEEIEEFMDSIPAADVQPVKHGRWILHSGGVPWNVIECSECGEKWHHWQGYATPNYCSNCGADMRGE